MVCTSVSIMRRYAIIPLPFISIFHDGQLYLEHFDRIYTFDATHIHSLHHKLAVRFNSKNLRYTIPDMSGMDYLLYLQIRIYASPHTK